MQRPTEIVPGLKSKELWKISELDKNTQKLLKKLKKSWRQVLKEGRRLREEEEKWTEDDRLIERGTWKQLAFTGR